MPRFSTSSRHRLTALVALAAVAAAAALVGAPAQAVGPVGPIPVGTSPSGVAVTDNRTAYVANSGFTSDGTTVSVINLNTASLITTITVGTGPRGVTLNPAGTKVYVANLTSGTVSVIDVATNTVTKTITGVGAGAWGVAFSPDGSRAYVSHYNNPGPVTVIDTGTETVLTTWTMPFAWGQGIAVSPNGSVAWVAATNDDEVFEVNLTSGLVNPTAITVGDFPNSLAFTPDGASLFVVNGASSGTVSVIDLATNTVVNTIAVGDYPAALAMSADGTRAYVPNESGGYVSVIDVFTETVLTTLPTPNASRNIGVSPDGRTLVTTNTNANSASVYVLDVNRVAGNSRYETAVKIAQEMYPSPVSVPYLYVATGGNYPDALASGPVAAKNNGPLLLTATDSLPAVVAAEVARLNPAKIIVIGGTGMVSDTVLNQLKAIQTDTTRIAGTNRYDTGRQLVDGAFTTSNNVWIATGRNFPDALSAGAVAAGNGNPVVLVDGASSTLDAPTLATLTALAPVNFYIAGSSASVSAGIEAQLQTVFPSATVHRYAGTNRYDTSLLINEDWFGGAEHMLLATGANFPDALAGTPWAGQLQGPMLVVAPECLTRAARNEIDRVRADQVTLLGGPGTLSDAVFDLEVCG